MFRLIKLAIYGLLGYAIYEFVRGVSQGKAATHAASAPGQPRQSSESRDLNRALNEDPGRANMTGPARGERVMSEEPSGESVPHMVGRGVVRR
jgi:hypothetical protein